VPFHLSERVRQQMLTAAFFQSIHCEITVVSVLLTKLSFVRDNSVKHAASPALRDCFSTRKRSFSHLLVLFEHHTPVASVCVCVCAHKVYKMDARSMPGPRSWESTFFVVFIWREVILQQTRRDGSNQSSSKQFSLFSLFSPPRHASLSSPPVRI